MLSRLLEKLQNWESVPEEQGSLLPIAAATLLMEVAWADHEIAEDELRIIRTALEDEFSLDSTTVEEIVEESRQHHDQSVGLHSFTSTINAAWEEPQKFALVLRLWRLAFADDSLNHFEEHMIRKIADLLYVSHTRFIEAKQIARQGLD